MNIENLAHEIALLSNASQLKLAEALVNMFPTRAEYLARTIDAVTQDELYKIEKELGLH
jgi:hypothetical protein